MQHGKITIQEALEVYSMQEVLLYSFTYFTPTWNRADLTDILYYYNKQAVSVNVNVRKFAGMSSSVDVRILSRSWTFFIIHFLIF